MLINRLKTAIPIIALVLLALFLPGKIGATIFAILSTTIIILGIKEFYNMTSRLGYQGYTTLTSIFTIALLITAIFNKKFIYGQVNISPYIETLIIITFIFTCFIKLFNQTPSKKNLVQLLISIAGFIYLGWCSIFIAKIYFSDGAGMNGRMLVLFFIAVTKMGDTGGFILGSHTAKRPQGNHKIAPKLSPKKSWEGLIGSIIFSSVAAIFLLFILGDKLQFNHTTVLNYGTAILLGTIFAILGFIGDIAESALKRASDIKDSGNIPGIGGALDLLDSLLLLAPIFYAYLTIMATISK